jgi:hypothetical protein
MRDVGAAGVGMLDPNYPNWIQLFTGGLDGIGPAGPSGNTDELEILSNNSGFDNEPVCNALGGANSSQIKLVRGTSNIPDHSIVMVFFADGTWTLRQVVSTNSNNGGPGPCTAGTPHVQLNINQGAGDTSGHNTPGGSCQPSALGAGNAGDPLNVIPPSPACNNADPCCTVTQVGFGSLVRYRIRNGADGVPNLERLENQQNPQVLARGIEDMQVQYIRTDGTVSDAAPAPVSGNYNTLVTQVRVTLAARATAGKFQGATTAANAPMAIRASLTSQNSPRQVLWMLTNEAIPIPKWN